MWLWEFLREYSPYSGIVTACSTRHAKHEIGSSASEVERLFASFFHILYGEFSTEYFSCDKQQAHLHNKCVQNLNKVELNQHHCKKNKFLGPINFSNSNDLPTGY
jgi:hypothetical protein